MIKFFCLYLILLFFSFQNIYSQLGWIQQTSPVNSNLTSVSFADANTGYACGGMYIIKTTNGGWSWFVLDSTLAASSKVKIQFVNQNTGFVSCNNYELYKTTNAGINWSLSASTDSRFGMVDNTFGWIFTYQQMYLTNDCGNTWSQGGIYPMTHAAASGGALGSRNFGITVGWYNDFMYNRVYMYIWKSLNGGGSWVCVPGGVFEDACAFARIDLVSTPAFTKAYVVDDNTAILYGGFQNYITHSSGTGWGPVNMGSTLGFDFINNTTGFSVGGNGSIQHTTTSGDSWIQQTTPVTAQLNSIDAINDTTAWAVGNSGTILNLNTGGIPPPPPILYSPPNNSTGLLLTPQLDWSDNIQAVNYRIQISMDIGFSNLLVDNSSLTISEYGVPFGLLIYNTVYYWRAAVKNSSGWGSFSEIWNFRTLGPPSQVILNSPPNNSADQPTNLTFNWRRAVETLSKEGTKLNFEHKPNPDIFTKSSEIDFISYYWFELTTDTMSFAGLIRDTTLIDTTKYIAGLSQSTNYYWRVKANNFAGWGPFSTWWKFTTQTSAPAPPLLVSPVNNAVGQDLSLTLVWRKSLPALSYRVQLAADSLFTVLIVNDSTITDSLKTISNLSPLTYYWWRVNAKNSGGTSGYSEIYKFRTIGYPNAVTLINPPNNAVNQPLTIQFVWSRASEQTSAFTKPLYRELTQDRKPFILDGLTENAEAVGSYWFDLVTDTVSLANLIRDTTLIDTNKSVSGLSNLTNYYWRVKARNQAGWGSYSVWFRFTTIVSMPTAPQLISPPNNSTGQNLTLNLLWYKSVFASTYRVQVATDSLFNNLIINDSTLTDTLKTISGLSPLTYYWWRVNATNTAGTSPYSTAWKFKTLGTPLQVNLINPPNNSINQPVSITFRWSRAAEQTMTFWNLKPTDLGTDGTDNISSYWFELVTDTVSMGNLLRDTTLADTTKLVSGLNNFTDYYWRVKAKNQIGWGGFSFWWKFTTIIGAPMAPVLASPPDNSTGLNLDVTLLWYKSTSASSYRVQVAADSLFTALIVNDSTLTDTARVVSGLNPLTAYWWRVNAKNTGGTSPYSSAWKFKTLGLPLQVNLSYPPNNSVDQPVSIQFSWNRASEQTNPFNGLFRPNSNRTKKISIFDNQTDETQSISNYWFELVTDTVSMANLLRDTTLSDTTKFITGLGYQTQYFWRVKARNQAGWGQFSTWWKFTTISGTASLSLKIIPGGFYDSVRDLLNMRDTIKVLLIDSATCTKIDSSIAIVDSMTFSASIVFNNTPTGTYYLYVYHRNHLPVSSRFEQNIVRGSTVSYDFTSDSSSAFGFNLIELSGSPNRWGMIPGDATRDGYIDGLDQNIWMFQNGLDGYLDADFNGDGYVDGLDQTTWIINNGQSYILPCETVFENFSEHQKRTKAIFNKEIERIFTPRQDKK